MSSVNPIGGFFELELAKHSLFHQDAIALNTGRNCLEYILRVRDYRQVFIPYYTCEVILEPFRKLGVDYTFYHINQNLELVDEIDLHEGEALLVTNYFGLKQNYIKNLAAKYGKNLIVDNTQAFFAEPITGIDTFYSCRKFFGVSDGAYLYCDKKLDDNFEKDESWNRMGHLLKRIDLSPENAYLDFCEQDGLLSNSSIKLMSSLTTRLMESKDYNFVAKQRRHNYEILERELNKTNGIQLHLNDNDVPMVYPYLTSDSGLRNRLIDNKIFVAKYWPNVLEWSKEDSIERILTNLVPLPIDQRYDINDMKIILRIINI